MTTPSDPFSPDPTPGYGAPPPAYGAPTPGFGDPYAGGSPAASPFGQPGGPQLANWGLRLGGYAIDFLITLAVSLPFFFLSEGLSNLVSVAVGVGFGYMTGTTGQTPGRKVIGITVRREADGQPLGAGAGIARYFLHILDALPCLLGFFWPLWDAKKQTFADKIIKSVVVKV